MRKISTLLFALATVTAVSAPASAADMRMPVKAPPPVPVAVYNWTGFYIGGFVGGAFADGDASTTDPCLVGAACPIFGSYNGVTPANYSLDSSVIGGGTIGYNWQPVGSQWVFGIEAEGGYMRLRGSSTYPGNPVAGDTVAHTTIGDFYAVIAGRIGWAWDRVLVYGKGGGVVSEVRSGVVDTCVAAPCGPGTINTSSKETVWGWAAGGGIEWAFANNWTVKAEYLYLGLDTSHTQNGSTGGGALFTSVTDSPAIHTAKVGINYKF